MRDYGREKEAITLKYRSDAAWYYRKVLHFKAKGIEFVERDPPKNATETAERAAEEAQKLANKGYNATANFLSQTDEKYQIKKQAEEATTKAKSAIMGFFSKKAEPAKPTTTDS